MPSTTEDAAYRIARLELLVDADPLKLPLSRRVIATNKRAFQACLAARSTVAAVLYAVRKRARKRR